MFYRAAKVCSSLISYCMFSSLKMVNMNRGIHRCQEHQLHMWRKVYNCTQKMQACQQILRACENLILRLIKGGKFSVRQQAHERAQTCQMSTRVTKHFQTWRFSEVGLTLAHSNQRIYTCKHPVLWKLIHSIHSVCYNGKIVLYWKGPGGKVPALFPGC